MTAITSQATPFVLGSDPANLSTPDLALVLFVIIDELYHQIVPDEVRLRPGHHRQKLSDPEVITLSVLQEAKSNDSEASFVRTMRRDYPGLFPGLLSTGRYHRRRKALVGVQQALFARLASEFARVAGWFAVDSAPVETTKVVRSQTGKKSIPEAAYHIGSCGRGFFFGFRLHTTVSDEGAIVEFALAPANEGERSVAEGMLAAVPPAETGVALGDNNYCGDMLRIAAEAYGHTVESSPRKTDKDRASRLWVRSPRVIVETVFAMLADQFKVETTRARSLLGVWSRVVAKVLAFDLSLYINALLGRPLLAVKSLYA